MPNNCRIFRFLPNIRFLAKYLVFYRIWYHRIVSEIIAEYSAKKKFGGTLSTPHCQCYSGITKCDEGLSDSDRLKIFP